MAELHLDPEDDRYEARKRELEDSFEAWLAQRGLADDGERSSDAGLFIDWRCNYSTGELSRLTVGDLQEFLLGWCPRKYSAPPSVAGPLCASLQLFVEYLADTDQLDGGAATVARLIRYLESNVAEVEAAMGDSSRFGMAKSLFSGGDPGQLFDAGSTDELQALLEQRIADHNALPIEQRRAVTDPLLSAGLSLPELVELPFAFIPPAADEVEESAAAAPLLATFDKLRDYLGEKGRTLTQHGNVKLADARALVDLLETGDVMDPQIGEQTFKTHTSRDLGGLSQMIDWASGAGAIRLERGRLLPVKRWASRSAAEKVERCWEYLLDEGALSWQRSRFGFLDDVRDLIEEGIPHWLLPILPANTAIELGEVVEMTRTMIREQTHDWEADWQERVIRWVEPDVASVFELIESVGVITWTDWHEVRENSFSRSYRRGGDVTLTPVGRQLVSELAEEAGYRLRTLPDLGQATAAEMLDIVGTNPIEPADVLQRWQSDASVKEQGAMIAEALREDSRPIDRLIAFGLLHELGAQEVAGSVRTLLDGPAGGHAALFLAENGLADPDELADKMGVGPIIDAMSLAADDPEELLGVWAQTIGSDTDTAVRILDEFWRHDAPETADVLEALGKTLPDKQQAKAARKALIKYRSRRINR